MRNVKGGVLLHMWNT